ncbi:hypothetical protein BT93_L5666 [Corymbia citriodora subsp. variegata]|uniref:Zeaxanthin epoxidase, chloroplastic n=1 Tax=Corymbia citriodora subsp. variegata TaxID=360336 RepID=A0A8T0CW96_CORYI|nr:hypothetical protein BT93_L5666 [Corymbia citriodora subsp. variegata]
MVQPQARCFCPLSMATLLLNLTHPPSFSSKTHFSVPISKGRLLDLSPCRHSRSSKMSSQKRRCTQQVRATVVKSAGGQANSSDAKRPVAPSKKLRVLVAGGGIGGLVFALAAKRKGFEVVVFEKELSAIRGEGQYRGPILIQSNALAVLEAIDMEVAEEVMRIGCIVGDRINGFVDGVSGTWYIKLDMFTPAVKRGLPVTRVISRISLQQILAQAVGEEVILNNSNVVDFEDDGTKVAVILGNGQRFEGDLLVGADGIWSKVREILFGPKDATYSGYTCYSGITDFVPADIETVGYRVFLGHKQYFVYSDVGAGKRQWYAFHKELPGGVDGPNGKKERLLKMFEGWCDNVIDLILATDEKVILRRDIYDRTPIFTWGKGHVTLLGDSIHAMQPNMGQGGCMAIEDSYQLSLELEKAWKKSTKSGTPIDVVDALKSYEKARRLRVAVIHGMARMATLMVSLYKSYLGVGLGPLTIPNPRIVGGRFFVAIVMPLILNWVLSGNSSKLEGRTPCCRLSDKANDQLRRWFEDDDVLERAMNREWLLLPTGNKTSPQQPICLSRDESTCCIIGSEQNDDLPGVLVTIPLAQISKVHAQISYKDGAFFVTDLQSEHGTWITNNAGRRYGATPNFPARIHPSDIVEFGSDKRAMYRLKVVRSCSKIPETERSGML